MDENLKQVLDWDENNPIDIKVHITNIDDEFLVVCKVLECGWNRNGYCWDKKQRCE